jgi:hypothetical protein
MKKLLAMLAIAGALTACNDNADNTDTADSPAVTAPAIDTTTPPAMDTTGTGTDTSGRTGTDTSSTGRH